MHGYLPADAFLPGHHTSLADQARLSVGCLAARNYNAVYGVIELPNRD